MTQQSKRKTNALGFVKKRKGNAGSRFLQLILPSDVPEVVATGVVSAVRTFRSFRQADRVRAAKKRK
jgi:hypothetical protein